jgi:hypothetical protein
MMKNIFTTTLLLISFLASAAPGDTTLVQAHQKVDMTWYQRYKTWANFPDASQSYHKIIMKFELGCASTGCSDWDYTTLININKRTGELDSNVSRIDTLQNNPLVVDTIWNVFDVMERIELAKVITPYAGNLPSDWNRTFYFDVTDYYPLLRDSVELEAFYQGWSSGFSVDLEFIMIEGTPPRNVIALENLYHGKFNYFSSSQFETNHMPARTVTIEPNAQQFMVRMAPSGHGFVNSLNCAEFCNKDYYVNVNGNRLATQAMWRNDCGLNALYPQAGTWLYDRANWCPGDVVNIYNHDVTNAISGSTATIDIDIEPYSYTVPQGETPANYNMSAQFFQMGDFNHTLDAEVSAIVSPTLADPYGRGNPVCHEATVEITNKGATTLTQAKIEYGVSGNGAFQNYEWTGQLEPLQTTRITMPMSQLSNWTSWKDTLIFSARLIEVNQQATDDVAFNNLLRSVFAPTPQLPGTLRFDLRTNNAANETHWELRDLNTNAVLYQGDNLSNNTSYRDTFNLSSGCYQLTIFDRGKDGLSFFANNDGNGTARLRNIGGQFFNLNINPNFGTRYTLNFTVGYGIGLPEEASLASAPEIFPNPAQDFIHLNWQGPKAESFSYEIMTLSGQTLQKKNLGQTKQVSRQLNLSDLSAGVYLLKTQVGQKQFTEKIRVL